MKLNSSVCAILLLLFGTSLRAQTGSIQANVFNSDSYRSIENFLSYGFMPTKHSEISINGNASRQNWLSFDTNSYAGKLGVNYLYHQRLLSHTLLSGYEYHSDRSDLTDSSARYLSKLGFLGYRMEIAPLDSLSLSLDGIGYMRNEGDQFAPYEDISSDGLSLSSKLRYAAWLNGGNLGADASYEHKDLDWEYYNDANASAWVDLRISNLSLGSQLSINDRMDKLFTLVQNQEVNTGGTYQQSDTQKRWLLNWNSNITLNPAGNTIISLLDTYSQRRTELETNVTRNNADYQNQASLEVDSDIVNNLSWKTTLGHNYAIKDFSYTNSTRQTELRSIVTTLNWVYGVGDSLVTGAAIDLQRTLYPDSDNKLDNDLRHINLRAGWKHYFKDRIRFNTILMWTRTDDVYIDSLLSGNNNRINSIVLSPECSIALGDRFLFRQLYQLRADYTDYIYTTDDRVNGLYRQFSGKFSLVYDSYPALARSGDSRWMTLPFRPIRDRSMMFDLSFGYERSEYGDQNGSFYVINSLTEKYTASCTLRHDVDSIYLMLQPKYSWGSWKEYSLQLGAAWKFNESSSLEILLSPYGEQLSELDWRTTASLSLQL